MEIALNIADESKALNFLAFVRDLGYVTIEKPKKTKPAETTTVAGSREDACGIWKDRDISLERNCHVRYNNDGIGHWRPE